MALDVSEYERLAYDGNNQIVLAPMEPAIAIQALTPSGASQQSAAFNAKTAFVMVHASENCRILFGTNPTANATTSQRIAAGETRFYGIKQNPSVPWKMAYIQST